MPDRLDRAARFAAPTAPRRARTRPSAPLLLGIAGVGTAGIAAAALAGIGRIAADEILRPRRWRVDERWPGVRFPPSVDRPAGPPAALCPIDGALRVVGPRRDCARGALPLGPLRVGDVVVAVDGVPTDPLHAEAISATLHERPAGSTVLLDVRRPCGNGRTDALRLSVPLPPATRCPADLGFPWEDVALSAPDGRTLRGWYLPPPGLGRPAPTLIYLHGRQTNRYHVGLTDLAPRARAHGYGLLLLDLFGSGDSDGVVDHWTAEDVELGWRYLLARPEIDPARIGIVGFSFGGYKALLAAADPALKPAATVAIAPSGNRPGLIRLLVPPPVLPGVVRRRLQRGFTPPAALFRLSQPIVRHWVRRLSGHDLTDVDPRLVAPRVRGPVMMVHGLADETFPPESAWETFLALPGPKRLRWLRRHDHFSICHAGDELWRPVFAFLDERLRSDERDRVTRSARELGLTRRVAADNRFASIATRNGNGWHPARPQNAPVVDAADD
jgi:dienelactone hydrolase